MRKSRLIQRLRPPPKKGTLADLHGNPFSFGGGLKHGGLSKEAMELLKDVFQFDYMGYAEFEWGAVPESLSRIYNDRENYISFSVASGYEPRIFIICRRPDGVEIHKRIMQWADERFNAELLETTLLNHALEGTTDICGWLELNNDFFFFIDEEMWRNTCDLFQIER